MKKLIIIFRSFQKNSRLTMLIVFCMALGVSASGIILGYVYQEYNYDCENANADRIHRVIGKDGETYNPYTFGPLAQSLKSNYPEIEDAVRVSIFYGYLACSTDENKINENSAIFADPGFFDLFSFPLQKGNSNDCLRAPNSVVISEKAAHKYFGDDDPIGKSLLIGENKEFIVTGIFEDFKDHSNFKGDLVLPLEKISKLTQVWIEPSWKYESEIHTFVLFENNKAVEGFEEKTRNHVAKYKSESKIELYFQPLSNIHVNKQIFWESAPQTDVKYLYVLIIVAFLIFGISLANFLFLYLGTVAQRAIGIGVKKVFGASKKDIFLEHFKEVMLLMLLSIGIAIILFFGYHSRLSPHYAFLPKIGLFDYKLALLLLAAAAIVTLLTGIYPALILSSQKPISLISQRKRAKQGNFNLAHILVVNQFILCISLLISTMMMHKQTRYMLSSETGYAKDELITIPLNMNVLDEIDNKRFELFTQELKKYSSIKNASFSYSSPSSLNSERDNIVNWEGKTNSIEVLMNWESVSYDYFETIGVKIIQGRSFSRNFTNDPVNWDKRRGAYILNEAAVKEMGIMNPIGKEFEVWGFSGPIIGIVEDYNFKSMHTGINPIFYQISPIFWTEIIVRIDPLNTSALNDIERVWGKFYNDLPLEINHVNNQVQLLYQKDQNLGQTLSTFSLLAVLIACMGLFTLTVLSVNQRTKEISIRKINGAKISEIMVMLNKDFVKLVGIAFIIATPVSMYTMHQWLENFEYKTNLSWWIYALAGLLTLGISLVTVSWKIWQAASINPVEALRHE
jgi:putative ABC transport system permease protein